jgi:hypothetical protein
MAFKTLVENPSPLERQAVGFIKQMTEKRGDFALAMLLPSEAALSGRWNLVVSAPWIDHEGLTAAIPTLTSELRRHLSKVNARKLERVSVLPTSDSLVVGMETLRIAPGQVYVVENYPLTANDIADAIVLVAQRPNVAGGYYAQPVHSRA